MLTVKVTGQVEVRAGYFATDRTIKNFVEVHSEWIKKQQARFEKQFHHRIVVPKRDTAILKKQLLPQITQLVEQYAPLMGVQPAGVKITTAQKRWGSCNSNKSVCFSYRLFYVSDRCKRYVVIHELSHLKELNHSKKFYEIVKKYMPDYKEAEKELAGYYIAQE